MDTRESVRVKIAETLDRPVEKVVDEVELLDLVQSSFLLVELVIELQEEFNVHFVQEDLAGVTTIAHLLDLVVSRVHGNG